MSALGVDDRKDSADVLHYAPPRSRGSAEEQTIRPVLERLSRGERQHDSSTASGEPISQSEPMMARVISRAPKIPLTMAGRLAIAVGLIAALAIPAVAFLRPHAEQSTAALTEIPKTEIPKTEIQKTEMPRRVHTISFQPEKPAAVKAQPASVTKQFVLPPAPQDANASDRQDMGGTGLAHPSAEGALALAAPLKLWAMFPDNSTPAVSSVPAEPPSEKVVHQAPPKHAARVRHHHRATATRHARHHGKHYARRHHPRRRAAATPAPAQQAPQSADSQAAVASPAKPNPIQAAINTILGKK